MCGIAGFFHSKGHPDREELYDRVVHMADTLRPRGPDDGGAWVDSNAGIALGHRRLSILDLSPEGHQPMISASGRYVIVFNGEIYNFEDLRVELECGGPAPLYRGHSDTEVMLAAFERWGLEESLRQFNGMFAFALWDRRERKLHLACDRLGEKPLYYGWSGPVFLFGSELKALRAHPDFAGDIDRDAITLFLRHNYVPKPYSIYRNIRKLEPGAYLTVNAEATSPEPQPVPYWSVSRAIESGRQQIFRGSPTEAADALDALLRDAVRLRMVADVPLGAFLSGGVDSSTVVALMQQQSRRPVRTFTIGFEDESYNEANHARAVARHLGTEHTELYVTPREMLTVIPSLPTLYDEPFADSSQIPTYLVSQLARRHVTVALSGDGGDELFGGYTRYFWAETIWRRFGNLSPMLKKVLAKLCLVVPPHQWDSMWRSAGFALPGKLRQRNPGDKLQKLSSVLAIADQEEMYLRLVSHWNEPAAVVVGATGEPPTLLTDRSRWPAVADFTHKMMYLDTVTYLPGDILVKLDRASMAVSLESRLPLLDHRVLEFAWSLPAAMKVRNGQGKWLLRQVLYRYVPRELIERPKTGFGVPLHTWLRGPLRDWAEELLSERRLRQEGYLRPEPIRRKWNEHLAGKHNWMYPLWNVLMFQAWLEKETRERTPRGTHGILTTAN